MHKPQDGLVSFFKSDHHHADNLWAAFEAACASKDEDAVRSAWKLFSDTTLNHFQMEEEVLFPEFEEQTGNRNGPTMVMRTEHERMRQMLDLIGTSVKDGDFEEALDQGDALLIFTGQHNQKEEGILYPMAERALAPQWPSIASALEGKRL